MRLCLLSAALERAGVAFCFLSCSFSLLSWGSWSPRKERDQYLLDMREKGWNYKDIKERGDCPEAESTLRGRVRVLMKDRSERVRKPEWTDRDTVAIRATGHKSLAPKQLSHQHHGRFPEFRSTLLDSAETAKAVASRVAAATSREPEQRPRVQGALFGDNKMLVSHRCATAPAGVRRCQTRPRCRFWSF